MHYAAYYIDWLGVVLPINNQKWLYVSDSLRVIARNNQKTLKYVYKLSVLNEPAQCSCHMHKHVVLWWLKTLSTWYVQYNSLCKYLCFIFYFIFISPKLIKIQPDDQMYSHIMIFTASVCVRQACSFFPASVMQGFLPCK